MLRTSRDALPPVQALLVALIRGEPFIIELSTTHPGAPENAGARDAIWTEALGLAARHGVAPLLHEQAQTGALPWLPEFARRELRASRIAELAREEKRTRVLRAALAVLAGRDGQRTIPTLLIKGAASARTLYPLPELRPRSDLDLLIFPSDRGEALERFHASGYAQHEKTRGTREDEPDWHERTLVDPHAPEQQLDLHFALAQAQRHRLDARTLFAASVAEPALGAAARILWPEEAALVCAHSIAIHELTSPLISLCDLARLLARCDLVRLAALARDTHLVRTLFVATSLLAWLGPPATRASLFHRDAPGAPFSLCGARVEPLQLASLLARLPLSLPTRRLLRAAAAGYDLARAPLPRAVQLWRKALFIDRPQDVARFAAAHALQTVRRAVMLATRSAPD